MTRAGARVRPLTTLFVVALVALALTLVGCGSKAASGTSASGGGAAASSSSQTTSSGAVGTIEHTKVKFVFHAGLAVGAFHRYIYKPFRTGEFSHPLLHKLDLIKAGLAAVFVVHEVKLAYKDANADPTLSKLTAPLNALATKVNGLVAGVKSGHPSVAAMSAAQGGFSGISSLAASAGKPVTDLVPHL